MTDIIPIRCLRAAAEMRRAEKNLRHEVYEIENVISALTQTEEESIHIAAGRLEGYLEELRRETRAASMLGVMLEKITEMYARTEAGIQDYMDEAVQTRPVSYSRIVLGGMTERAREYFEEL